jgi:hypothetical protein
MVPMLPEDAPLPAPSDAQTLADGRRFTDADTLDAMILRCCIAL